MAISKHFSEQYQWWYFFNSETGETWWMEQPPEPEGAPPVRFSGEATGGGGVETDGVSRPHQTVSTETVTKDAWQDRGGQDRVGSKVEISATMEDVQERSDRTLIKIIAFIALIVIVVLARSIGTMIGHGVAWLF